MRGAEQGDNRDLMCENLLFFFSQSLVGLQAAFVSEFVNTLNQHKTVEKHS